jgi:hypothetical protein
MGTGVPGVDATATVALEQRDGTTSLAQQVRGGDTGNAAADHGNVDIKVSV